MLRTIEMYTNEYKDTTKKEIRKKKGQFFTPAEVSMRMAAVENKYPKNQLIRVLDPGAGNGILSFAVIDKLLRSGYKWLDITLIETDTEILPVLEYTITKIRQICESYHAECTIHYIDQNFVLWESSRLYDIVICNPPYMKVRKDSIEATAMKAYVYGQPNLYGLFMAKAVELLRDNGQYIFITPRSWTSGKYFTKVRSFLQKELNIKEIDLFSSRDEVFQGEKVLQETMILYGEKGQIQDEQIKINILKDGTLDTGNSFWAAADQIKFKGSEQYLLLPENENDLKIIDIMSDMTDSFESSGYHFKTGPVVEFRNLDHIHKIYQTILQFRRQDRSRIKAQTSRAYYHEGKKIAKNRKKAEGQRDDSLQEWRKRQVERYGKEQTRKMISQLEVKESIRRYNRLDRLMPGAVFYYQGVRYVMRGQHSNGQYLQAVGMGSKDFPAKKCKIVANNEGLVFVS